jgi:hypothetical protein
MLLILCLSSSRRIVYHLILFCVCVCVIEKFPLDFLFSFVYQKTIRFNVFLSSVDKREMIMKVVNLELLMSGGDFPQKRKEKIMNELNFMGLLYTIKCFKFSFFFFILFTKFYAFV